MQRFIADETIRELEARGVTLRNARILELGAGRGGYTQRLSELTSDLVAVDLHRSDVFDEELRHVRFETLDVRHPFPFGVQEFDFILCSSLVEHLSDRSNLYRECRRVLKPSGTALISFPPFWSLTMVGGHQFKPFHFLGESIAVRMASRRLDTQIHSYDHDYGEGELYPITISQLNDELETNQLRVVDSWGRMTGLNTVKLPGLLADLFTWHACFLVRASSE